MSKPPYSPLIKFIAVLVLPVAFSVSLAHAAEPPKSAANAPAASKAETAKLNKQADQTLTKIKKSKAELETFNAAVKSKDTARIKSVLVKNGFDPGPVMTPSGPTCYRMQNGNKLCITFGANPRIYIESR